MREHLELTQPQYVAALKRNRQRIAEGLPLNGFDCTAVGAKDTQCSWGLCSDDLALWPDAADHLFPERLPHRSSPKYRADQQTCPLQTSGTPMGCFYRCRFFQEGLRETDRAAVLALYDERIKGAEHE